MVSAWILSLGTSERCSNSNRHRSTHNNGYVWHPERNYHYHNRFPINVHVDLRASHLHRHRLGEHNTKLGPCPAHCTHSIPCSAYCEPPTNTSGRTGRGADKEDQCNSDKRDRLLHPDSNDDYGQLYRVTLCLFKSATVHAFRLLVELLHNLRLFCHRQRLNYHSGLPHATEHQHRR